MDQIIEQLMKLNKRDWLDVVGVMIPIILTIIIIIQNKVYSHKTDKLEKYIYNRDQINQYHSYIVDIYNTYYDFCETIFTSGFDNNVKNGNVNFANAWINNLVTMRLSIGKKMDLAKLIFRQKDKKLYDIVEERFQLSIKIIDKYMEYINSGKLYETSENAWTIITSRYPRVGSFKYNYAILIQDKEVNDNFVKLCKNKELEEIQKLIEEYQGKHSYDNFDKYFEKYFVLDKL